MIKGGQKSYLLRGDGAEVAKVCMGGGIGGTPLFKVWVDNYVFAPPTSFGKSWMFSMEAKTIQ
jgi:hypothetical protein